MHSRILAMMASGFGFKTIGINRTEATEATEKKTPETPANHTWTGMWATMWAATTNVTNATNMTSTTNPAKMSWSLKMLSAVLGRTISAWRAWRHVYCRAKARLWPCAKYTVYNMRTGCVSHSNRAHALQQACSNSGSLDYVFEVLVEDPDNDKLYRILARNACYMNMDRQSLLNMIHAKWCRPGRSIRHGPRALMAQIKLSPGFVSYVDVTDVFNECWSSFDSKVTSIGGDNGRLTAAQFIIVLAARGVINWRQAAMILGTPHAREQSLLRILTSDLQELEFRPVDIVQV